MNRKISGNEKRKYSNEVKLSLGEDKNTNSLINIAQEDDSNIFVYIYIFLYIYIYVYLQLSVIYIHKYKCKYIMFIPRYMEIVGS